MSNPNDPEFDKLHRLLALKRYERPPQGYFDRFPDEFRRRQRTEPLRQPSWWEQLAELFRGEPLLAARYALGSAFVLLLCVNALFLVHRPPGGNGTDLASSQPVTNRSVVNVAQPVRFEPMPPPELFAERPQQVASNTGPQYILDRVNVAPASYDASVDF